ncbi:receptor-binding cancer antigen expressed on SiSo cells [Octopus sinensis]|uniref:Receptor-binding cancer antigen expressed on SiSo cells n=1 Tax=Octopus sinensis TaxID=2607531 RepID=A0A6P7TFN3_9MOLL|nr:receptor-binding cancer antigen expressed on SiSo cells [Octopus sinensis]XP_029650109.1 receptor-binding cancer antigen expressed on SiSo cells [Octopus sinensis]
MKILVNFVKKIFNIVFLILSPVRRLICRRRRHSDTPILPLNAVYSAPHTVSTSSLPPEGELQPWESWEMEDPEYKSSRNRNKSENGEQEPDIDFFQDMAPKIKRTTKILVKKDSNEKLENPANRLAMTSEFPVTQDTELGIWEENGKCWEEASEDLSWQVDATIKEKKRVEREARQQEHLRKKQEKELVRGLKKDSPFAAVRLS